MCGIAGIAALDPQATTIDATPLQPMLACLRHRGPDDEGQFVGDGVVLGHRRLSVIDVHHGQQPLCGARSSTQIVANGEIYNYRELARELTARGHVFRTASDIEVAAHAYDEWGIDFLQHLDGMFALALWDGAKQSLLLARDRMGEKPLYYTTAQDSLLFASELTALLKHPAVTRELDTIALSQYLALEYVPAPRTILRDIYKLEPATALVLRNGSIRKFRYWQIDPHTTVEGSFEESVAELRQRLDHAVASRLVSDVPLGIFLSGGIDSSTIAALAARHGALETFSIGFDERSFDESTFARAVAQHIGSRHHERIFKGSEVTDLVPKLGGMLDEPLGDASILPTALLSSFAREHVTVAVGGDGGDELFAGYPMHAAQRIARYARGLPAPFHALARLGTQALPVAHSNFPLRFKALSFLRGAKQPAPLNHAYWMSSFTADEQRRLLRSHPDTDPFDPITGAWNETAGAPLLARATHLDARTYLPNDILMKVDRASMSVALEVRAPFLARDVVELAFSVPDEFRMRGLTGKRMLRAAVKDLLPPAILDRPKKGFGIPVAAWLNGPLRELVRDVFDENSIARAGLFDIAEIRRMLQAHADHKTDYRKPLWTLFVFELWRRQHLA